MKPRLFGTVVRVDTLAGYEGKVYTYAIGIDIQGKRLRTFFDGSMKKPPSVGFSGNFVLAATIAIVEKGEDGRKEVITSDSIHDSAGSGHVLFGQIKQTGLGPRQNLMILSTDIGEFYLSPVETPEVKEGSFVKVKRCRVDLSEWGV